MGPLGIRTLKACPPSGLRTGLMPGRTPLGIRTLKACPPSGLRTGLMPGRTPLGIRTQISYSGGRRGIRRSHEDYEDQGLSPLGPPDRAHARPYPPWDKDPKSLSPLGPPDR